MVLNGDFNGLSPDAQLRSCGSDDQARSAAEKLELRGGSCSALKLPHRKRILIGRRNDDARRNDETFVPLFQIKSSRVTAAPRWKFVKRAPRKIPLAKSPRI